MIVGITGGIGSGKSLVARLLRMYGPPVYDSDTRAKSLYDEDDVLRTDMIRLFGERIYAAGRIDKKMLSDIVFANTHKLAQLDALVHPAVFRDFSRWCEAHSEPIVFAESAILLQTDFRSLVDKVVVVDAPIDVRVARAIRRDRTTAEAVSRRILAQKSSAEMRDQADYIIENDDRQSLLSQIDDLVRSLSASI